MNKRRIISTIVTICLAFTVTVGINGQISKGLLVGDNYGHNFQISTRAFNLNSGSSKTIKTRNAKGKVTWKSSNSKIATVSSSGVVKGKKAGKVIITVSCPDLSSTLKATVKVFSGSSVRSSIMKMKRKYPEGKRYTNSNFYYWKAINCNCYGCIAFAGIVSDNVFGRDSQVTKHRNFSQIKPGDHIRTNDNNSRCHSVIVLSRSGNKVKVVEGNYNYSIHWNRTITKSQLQKDKFYVQTRY